MFRVGLDLSEVMGLLDLEDTSTQEIKRAAGRLAAATHQHIISEANHKLHSRRNAFVSALDCFQVDDGVWVVSLDKSARWIDEGKPAGSMLDDLLKSKSAKRAKDGSTYVVVPFQHNKDKQDRTSAQSSLLETIKKELKKAKTSLNEIETYANGTPKLGLVRSMDINMAPKSTSLLRIGRGRLGDVAQGNTGIPLLRGVRVYQKPIPNVGSEPKVGRFIMTFRVASSKQRGTGKWDHPGLEGMDLMQEGLEWALSEWKRKVAPGLVDAIVAKLG